MRNHFYFEVMRRTIVQFLDLFNNMRIARYDETGRLLKMVSVPLKFAPKMKNWWWDEKLDENGRKIRDLILPIIGVNMTDVELNSGRIVNKGTNIRKDRDIPKLSDNRFKNPVPYDMTFEVKIASKYMIDITQILEQILPFFDPTLYIRVTIPDLNIDHKEIGDEQGAYPLDLKVVLESNSKEESIDMNEDEYRTIIWTLTFRVEGWLFKPTVPTKVVKYAFIDYYNREMGTWPIVPQVETTTTGISAEKYPIYTTAEELSGAELSGALYDDSVALWYKYEREGD